MAERLSAALQAALPHILPTGEVRVKAEPVAWRRRIHGPVGSNGRLSRWVYTDEEPDFDGEVWQIEPLYAAPPPAADVTEPTKVVSPADAFADWINAGPLLAAAAGKHVSMQVTDTASPPVSTDALVRELMEAAEPLAAFVRDSMLPDDLLLAEGSSQTLHPFTAGQFKRLDEALASLRSKGGGK